MHQVELSRRQRFWAFRRFDFVEEKNQNIIGPAGFHKILMPKWKKNTKYLFFRPNFNFSVPNFEIPKKLGPTKTFNTANMTASRSPKELLRAVGEKNPQEEKLTNPSKSHRNS